MTPRIQPFVAPCRVIAGGRALAGYLTDLSEAGARVQSDAPPPTPEAEVTLELRIGRVPARSRLTSRVEWVKPDGKTSSFGLSFAAVPAEQQNALKAVVEEFRRLADVIAS
jgi:Tfp pilus assembly protein PilZ